MTEGKAPRGGPVQTRAYLMEMLEATGLSPRRQLGQNFLIDLNLLQLLVETANPRKSDVVLEVGAGTGGLTSRLAERAGQVISVELDPGFYHLACRETKGFNNVTLIHGDALAHKNQMNPEVLDSIRQAMAKVGTDHYHLAANLPYDVAALVIANLLLEDLPVRSMTFTVQFEMAERIASLPGKKDYGPLSVLVQTIGHVSWVRTLPPSVFWPRPQVQSAILRIDVDDAKRQNLVELREAHRFIRDLFVHRRKTLRAGVASIPGLKRLKGHLDAMFAELELPSDGRAEQLTPEELHRLFHGVKRLAETVPEST